MNERSYADELLARFTGGAASALAHCTAAKAANPAKTEQPCGPGGASASCEGLRIAANPGAAMQASDADSQTFAGVRNLQTTVQSEQACGSSQHSQDSQGLSAQRAFARPYRLTRADADRCHASGWADAEIATFTARTMTFMRRGISATDADDLAERLTLRDRDGDVRRMCVECGHYRPGRCGNHQRAGLHTADLGLALAVTLQRCAGFRSTR